MTDSLKSTEPTETTYAPPKAVHLGDSGVAKGYDCGANGSGAPSACTMDGSSANACLDGTGTGGEGACDTGYNASHNCEEGMGAAGKPGCHDGSTTA
jgi:hypothetical protein